MWESQSQERVPDSVKSAVLAECAPQAVSEHARVSADKLDGQIKRCAVDCVVSKNTGPTPMEVGALVKGKEKRQRQRQHMRPRPRRWTQQGQRRRQRREHRHRQRQQRRQSLLEGQDQLVPRMKSRIRWVLRQLLEVRSQVERLLATWKGPTRRQSQRDRWQWVTIEFGS